MAYSLVVLFLFVALSNCDFYQWTGKALKSGDRIKMEAINDDSYPNPKNRNPPQYVYPSGDWTWWSRYVLAGTTDTSKINSDTCIFEVVSSVPENYAVAAVPTYAYSGYRVCLKSSGQNQSLYYWQTNVQTGPAACSPMIFATSTYNPPITVLPPFMWWIQPGTDSSNPYPSGLKNSGSTALINVGQPVGHWSWVDPSYNMNKACIYRLWVESPVLPPSEPSSSIPVWKCTADGVFKAYYDPAIIQRMGQTCSSIKISSDHNADYWVQTASDTVFAMDSMRYSYSLSHSPSNDYTATWMWTGPQSSRMWNTCGWYRSFNTAPFWSCNNGDGPHLTDSLCRWSLNQPTPATGITIYVTLGETYIPIFRCMSATTFWNYGNNAASISAWGTYSSGIKISSNQNPNEYAVTASPTAYPMSSLAKGVTLSFAPSGQPEPSSTYATDWVGPQASHMWCSCGSNRGFLEDPYWACNNGNGLHIDTVNHLCGWTSSTPTPGGITIYVAPTVPVPADLLYVRIYSCSSDGVFAYDYSPAVTMSLAKVATEILIMTRDNPNEWVASSSTSPSSPLTALIAGRSLSHPATGYVNPNDWYGTMLSHLWNSCGDNPGFGNSPFWACNNGNGLHLRPDLCRWSASQSMTEGIGIWLRVKNTDAIPAPTGGLALARKEVSAPGLEGNNKEYVVAGVVAGILILVMIGIIVVVYLRKRSAGGTPDATDYAKFTEE